jgi:hypothetical protein
MLSASLFLRTMAATLLAGHLSPNAPPAVPPPSPAPVVRIVDGRGAYSGYIEQVWSQFEVWRGGEKGMVVHVRFHTTGLRGVACKAVAYFAYEGGEALDDFDGLYSTVSGKVSTYTNFTPSYDSSVFNDLELFIPYSQLHMGSGRSDLEYHVELYTIDYNTHFAESRPVTFQYNQG